MKEAKSSYVAIFITAALGEEAERIADALLVEKLAACVNILSGVRSFFWWQDKIERADEVLLVVKTETRFLDDIIKLVKKLHSYEVPEIIALPIVGGNEEYMEWISKSVERR